MNAKEFSIVLKPKERSISRDDAYIAHAIRAAELAAGKRAKHIKAYNVHGLTLIADAFVLCTVTSEPQMKAVYNAVREGMKEAGLVPLGAEGSHRGSWILIDYGDVLVHIFREEAREFYDLDGLWGDAPEVPLDIEA